MRSPAPARAAGGQGGGGAGEAGSDRGWKRRWVAGAGPAALAVATTAGCAAGGWRGPDVAAQAYRVGLVQAHGLAVWDPGWYGGTFPLNYSVVFPAVAAVVGVWVAVAAAAGGAAAGFDHLVRRGFGRRPLGSWYFALSTGVEVLVGQWAFLAGEALALAAVVVLAGRWGAGAGRPGRWGAGGP
ncbi:MAG: hypothetical protein ACRDY0_11385, partial [Acidimicrobiales bacterium]